MEYKKLLKTTPYKAGGHSSFNVDPRSKVLVVGSRDPKHRDLAYLGKVYEQSRTGSLLDFSVGLDLSFPHVIGIFGSRGSGKSYDLGVILEGVFSSSRNDVTDAAIVFDIQDQFWTLAFKPDPELKEDAEHIAGLSRWGIEPEAVSDLKVWVPQCSDTQVPGAEKFSLAGSQLNYADWLSLLELERFSPMGQALSVVLEASTTRTPEALADLCDADGLLSGFQQATVDGLKWRIESLESTEIIGATGISVDDLLQKGGLTVVLMRNLSDAVRGLIVGVVSRLVSDRMGRIQQQRKVALRTKSAGLVNSEGLTRRLWLVLDEAHVLVPADGATAATAPLIDYVKRGRDAGLSLVFATQQPSAVNSKLMSQVDLTLTHMLGFETDLSAASARMPTRASVDYDIDSQSVSNISDIIRSLGPGECVVADSASPRIFVAKVRPRSTAHGGATPT